MDRVLAVDATSRLARVQAGVFGPRLEEQLRRAGWTLRPLPRQLHALDARRLDRDALLGDAVRPVRRHRRPDAGLRVVTPAGHAGNAPGPDAPPPARACARWCWAARAGWGSSPRRRSTCTAIPERAADPRLPVPRLAERARRDARHRRRRGRAVGHACVGRQRDARSRSRPRRRPRCSIALKSKALAHLPRAPARLRPRCDVPVVHRLRGQRGPRRRPAQARRARSSPSTAGCASARPGRALRPEEVRHPLHPRLPARPRGPGRRLGDLGAVVGAAHAVREYGAAARGVLRRSWREGLRDVPPVALLSRGRVPVLHLRLRPRRAIASRSSNTIS